jgi:IclR family transcriptional regulator, pca regulon regulatory protein
MVDSRTYLSSGSGDVKDSRAPEGMAGLAKGLAIIEAFGPHRTRLSISDAARLTDLSRATARRCLLTLVELGYLSQDGRDFSPTPRMLRLGNAYTDGASLPVLAKPHLVAVRDRTGESCSLAVLDGSETLFVARAEAQRIVTTGVRIGVRIPAHLTATGQVLLAGLPGSALEDYLAGYTPAARTPHTVTDPAALRARIDAARADGVAHTDEELELGLRSMAVPIVDSRGATVAAMSVSVSAARVTLAELRDDFLPVLRAEAVRLARVL